MKIARYGAFGVIIGAITSISILSYERGQIDAFFLIFGSAIILNFMIVGAAIGVIIATNPKKIIRARNDESGGASDLRYIGGLGGGPRP
jgi:ABC-type lipoprotein release transport system permease subunit